MIFFIEFENNYLKKNTALSRVEVEAKEKGIKSEKTRNQRILPKEVAVANLLRRNDVDYLIKEIFVRYVFVSHYKVICLFVLN